MISVTEVRKGMMLKLDERLYFVMNVSHHTPGNKRSVIHIKLRDLESGSQREERYSGGDKVEQAITEDAEMEYLYQDGESYVFMNQENYEQSPLHKDVIGDDVQWLKENMVCTISFFEGRVIGVPGALHRGTAGEGHGARAQGRHRHQRVQARHPRDRRDRLRSSVHREGGDDSGRHARREVSRAGKAVVGSPFRQDHCPCPRFSLQTTWPRTVPRSSARRGSRWNARGKMKPDEIKPILGEYDGLGCPECRQSYQGHSGERDEA